jgi:hypothetical protein
MTHSTPLAVMADVDHLQKVGDDQLHALMRDAMRLSILAGHVLHERGINIDPRKSDVRPIVPRQAVAR